VRSALGRSSVRHSPAKQERRRAYLIVASFGETGVGIAVWYVYIIKSIAFPDQKYIGATSDLKKRMADHNAGKSRHTSKFIPWEIACYIAFPDKYKALEFETYLKSHSGRAFSNKRFV
jgi:predicted GIY-YIG superfamily endonuclease